jgi:predicted  nucleic acid-binding Zn-ribbon protein
MIDERFLQRALTIRRTYFKLINNLDLYKSRALKVSERLDETLKKLEDFQKDLEVDNRKTNLGEKEIFEKLLKIIDEVEDEGKRLEKLIEPVNIDMEKLAKEEQELYRQIVETHPNLSEEQIVNSVRDRLTKEGLS